MSLLYGDVSVMPTDYFSLGDNYGQNTVCCFHEEPYMEFQTVACSSKFAKG